MPSIGAQQLGTLAALFLLGRFAVGLQRTAPGQLVQRRLAVFGRDLAGRRAVQVEALRRACQCDQVAGAAGVPAQEGRQRRLGEHTGRTRLDVGLDAQLQRLGRADEQCGEMLSKLLGTVFGARCRGGNGRGIGGHRMDKGEGRRAFCLDAGAVLGRLTRVAAC